MDFERGTLSQSQLRKLLSDGYSYKLYPCSSQHISGYCIDCPGRLNEVHCGWSGILNAVKVCVIDPIPTKIENEQLFPAIF